MPSFCVTSRHSPLPRKRLIVRAADSNEALRLFVEENRRVAGGYAGSGPRRLELISQWEAENGLATVDVEDALDDEPCDLPASSRPSPATGRGRTGPLPSRSQGRLGRRPTSEGGDEFGDDFQRSARRSRRERLAERDASARSVVGATPTTKQEAVTAGHRPQGRPRKRAAPSDTRPQAGSAPTAADDEGCEESAFPDGVGHLND